MEDLAAIIQTIDGSDRPMLEVERICLANAPQQERDPSACTQDHARRNLTLAAEAWALVARRAARFRIKLA